MTEHTLSSGDSVKFQHRHMKLIAVDIGPKLQFIRLLDGGVDLLYTLLDKSTFSAEMLFLHLATLVVNRQEGNLTYFHPDSIMEKFSASKSTVYRAYRQLIDSQLIKKVKKGHYLMHPNIVFRGKEADRLIALEEWNALCKCKEHKI